MAYATPMIETLGSVSSLTRGECGLGFEDWDWGGSVVTSYLVCTEYCPNGVCQDPVCHWETECDW